MNNETLVFKTKSNVSLAYQLSLQPQSLPSNKLITISHPLARLGGSKNDHVVQTLASYFFDLGFGVLIYDSRGSGDSGGSCSFSSIPEAEDYAEIIESILLPLFSNSTSTQNSLVCAGYSAGSLSALSYIPPTSSLLNIKTSYLLISYPYSVLFALTMLHAPLFQSRLRESLKAKRNTLAIWGDQDQFTSATKFRKWSDELKSIGSGENQWKGVEIEGADHFWGSSEKKEKMLNSIGTWLNEIGLSDTT